MKQFSQRIWIAAILLCFGLFCTLWVRSGYTFNIQPLHQGLETFPLDLVEYRGVDLPLDEDVSRILAADATMNRAYRRSDGTSIVVHASAWVRPENVSSVAPHSPKICYTNAGWKILEERPAEVDMPSGRLHFNMLLLERDEDRCVVSYWYQMGDSIFTTAAEARQVHRNLWGKAVWPATLKFMIQFPARDIDSALPQIKEFASTVFQWSLTL